MACITCGTKLPRQSAGRPRKFCGVECRTLNDAINRLESAIGPVAARLLNGTPDTERSPKAVAGDHQNLVELRYRLFCLLGDEVPRPRHPKGHPNAGGFVGRARS